MCSRNIVKLTVTALTILLGFLLTGAGQLWAFSVDVKNLYYADNVDPSTLKRVVNYDFSGGTLTSNTIAIDITAKA